MTSATALLNPSRIDFPWIEQVLERYEADPTVWDRATFPVKALFHLAAHAFTHRPAVVHYISDNGNYADAARGEIAVRLADIPLVFRSISGSPAVRTEYHDIPAQDTNAAAFDLAQFARGTLRGFGNVFFVNCAPRKKQRGVEKSNGGESVYIGILPNGAIVAGTGEDVFVHFRDLIEAGQFNVYRANVATNGTQFRSRDYFPWLAALVGQYIDRPDVNRKWRSGLTVEQRDQILFGLGFVDREVLLNPKHFDILPSFTIIRADTHGNLKLDQRHEKLAVALGDDS
ncbi:MAG TPA: hypothetical protein VMV79_01300, partial [Alphaproteobacteria bacterium]|nr:hypothetical protein [Alphaproteobacteria bacterium]